MCAQRSKPYTVYLSSTLKDLAAEREAVTKALGGECVVKHSYGASEDDLVTSCLDDVAECDLYIGILGLRYGYVPPRNNRKKLSITEFEYERAGKIPRHVFLKAESAIQFTSTDHCTKENPPERIERFRERAGGGADQRPALFETPQELAFEVLKAFNKFKERRDRPAKRANKRAGRSRKAGPSQASVRSAYLDWLREECERIILLGLDNKDRQNVRLAQVYVPALTTARSDPPGATRTEARPERQHELLLHRVAAESLYVPGAPGSGKSTFCRWLALCVARGEIPRHPFETAAEFEEKLPAALRGRFPLLCRLRHWAGHRAGLAGQGDWTRKHLEDSIAAWIDATSPGGLTAAVFRDELKAGHLLLILDGVDEVPKRFDGHYPRGNLLTGLADALREWTRKNGNRVLLTSRPYGVEGPHRQSLGLPIAELEGLPRELQSMFVRRWYAASDSADAGAKAEGLLEHLDGRPDLNELRPNPMLLTALCVKYDEGKRLPGDLYRLYDSVVDLVLYKRYATEQERDVARLRLAAVALAMHQGPSNRPRDTPEPEVPFDELDDALAALNKTDPASERGTLDASTRREGLLSDSGLLLPRADKRAGFYHLSFQEFLAAMRLRRTGKRVADLLDRHASTPGWRPTLRFLFCAIADQQSPEYALEDFSPLSARLEPAALEQDPNPALLLADCLEVGHTRGWNLQRFHESLRRACDHALANVVPPASAHLWRVLGLMGLDDRSGVGVKDGVPDIDWVEIPPGECLYGEERRKITLPAFAMARYPVTHAQFEAFVEDGGYENEAWWQWPEHRPAPGRPGWSIASHPCETVSWYEAMAFCNWLEARLRRRNGLEDGRTIRLPREQEWERAARGDDGREFPWGSRYEAGRANINETYGKAGPYFLKQTSAVGIYPGGASPFGLLDMAGNVWEWCSDKYDPKDKGDDVPRVLRGGSWSVNRDLARAAYRNNYPPLIRYYNIGFRVVCSSPISVEL